MGERVTAIRTHVRLPFRYYAGTYTARYLRGALAKHARPKRAVTA